MRKLTATLCMTLAALLASKVRAPDMLECEGSTKEVGDLARLNEWDNFRNTLF